LSGEMTPGVDIALYCVILGHRFKAVGATPDHSDRKGFSLSAQGLKVDCA